MADKIIRKIVKIDEEKCNGCGACVPACAEGALKIIDGKARLVSEIYCDGLGACLGNCPQDAITVEEREAVSFDEVATEHHLAQTRGAKTTGAAAACPSAAVSQFGRESRPEEETLPCGCSSATATHFERKEAAQTVAQSSTLSHWPLQLALVPPGASFLRGADVLLVGDCVPFAYGSFHRDFLKDHAVLVACPKLDDFSAHLEKLTGILRQSDIRSLSVLHMEVPCCFGLVNIARQAIAASGNDIPLTEITISVQGDIKSLKPV
ncbi:MAG: 4Fe-4S binding protein [Dehalococcoidales bacterium]|jgi:Fe-S-cluster-containing hydrogenase component 2